MRYMYDGDERDGVIANRENSPNAAKKKVPDGVTLTHVVVSAPLSLSLSLSFFSGANTKSNAGHEQIQ